MADYSGMPGDAAKAFSPIPAKVLARDEPCADPEQCDVHAARGSDDEYCSVAQQDGHHWVSHSVQASALRWIEICSTCQRINQGKLLEAVVSITRAEVGEATTRQLLEELRVRGDLAMVAMPTTPRGADGAVLSAMAGSQLKALEPETLNAKRGE